VEPVCAVLLPRVKKMESIDGLITTASGCFAIATIGSGLVRSYALMILFMLLGGAAWMVVLSSLNVAARMVVPAWVQARSLSIDLLGFQGGAALGSLAWGSLLARRARFFPLLSGESLDLTPAAEWPHPTILDELGIEKGTYFCDDRISH
jgi:hypothetical protein